MHYRFLIRDIYDSGKLSILFIFCVALSITSLTALNSFKRDVEQFLLSDAQALHGGDIIIHAHQPISLTLQQAIDDLEAQRQVEQLKTYDFYSVVRPGGSEKSLFANIKVVESDYPFYGSVTLKSGQEFREVLKPGKLVVAQEVLERLSISAGTKLHIGDGVLEIADIVLHETARPVSFLSIGPRIFVSAADLDSLGLLGKGSRASYEILLKASDRRAIEGISKQLSEIAVNEQERVETAQNARSGVKRFIDNLLFFLSFICIFTLLLGGIGMQSSLLALLREKEKTIAIIKTIGATNGFLHVHYYLVVLSLGIVGCLGGIGAGYLLKQSFPYLFQGILFDNASVGFAFVDVVEGLVLGLVVMTLFTFLPLYRLGGIKPVAIFRREIHVTTQSGVRYATYLTGLLFLSLLVIRQLEDIVIGVYFMIGFVCLIAVITAITILLLKLIRSFSVPWLPMRQALRSLYRPGNASRSIIVTLTSALSVLMTIYLVEYNLFSSFVDNYPEDAPNLFCLDIQKNQMTQFRTIVGEEVVFFPVIRARLLSINGKDIDRAKERERKSDSLAREFNLTYRENLLKDERIIAGDRLFFPERTPPDVTEVSILDTIADIGNIKLNDRLVFNIQGVMLDAQVTSIRERTKSKLYPFFYFVFSSDVLEDAPQTLFAALHIDKEKIPGLISRIVTAMPHVSTINVAETAVQFGELIKKLSKIITFFAAFAIVAGCLILINAVFATRMSRIREAVYYRVLGGRSRFVMETLIWENALLGFLSSMMAVCFANFSAGLLCRFVFEISYRANVVASLLLIGITLILIVAIGLVSSVGILRQRPAAFLRQQNGV